MYKYRFIVLRGSSGFYTYGIYEHKAGWPDFGIGETRVAFKLRKDKLVLNFKIELLLFT